MYYLETKCIVLKTIKVLAFFLIALLVGNGTLFAQKNETSTVEKEELEHKKSDTSASLVWYSFENALRLNGERAAQGLPTKKIFVDVYTAWCGWCKRMDATTFAHPVIVEKLNRDWIPVKMDAERKDTVVINGQMFVYEKSPNSSRGAHQLAAILLNGQMSYPSYTLIDETGKSIQVVQGYRPAQQFEMLLDFFSSNVYKTTDWQEFQKTYQGLVRE
jgi:thioredoxin-related protein